MADTHGYAIHSFIADAQVLYFKWAGDNMETPSGEKYVVVHEQVHGRCWLSFLMQSVALPSGCNTCWSSSSHPVATNAYRHMVFVTLPMQDILCKTQ
jgi:hypothetical protein